MIKNILRYSYMKMERPIIIPITGYMGSGSSAVINLLDEYSSIKSVPQLGRVYEHIPFYFRGGLFDLYSTLKDGTSPMNSDANINRFLEAMRVLNDNKFIWCGNYKSMFGSRFMDINYEFISRISSKYHAINVNHYTGTRFSFYRLARQIGARVLLGRKVYYPGIQVSFDKNQSYIGLPTKEELDAAAKKYTADYFALFTNGEEGRYVFDHTILPQQIDAFSDCFEDNVKIIVVNRDPRDIFLLNKYVWFAPPIGRGKPFFPTDVKEFAALWKRMVKPSFNTKKCLVINFEDLIYQYERTVAIIEKYLEIDSSCHVRPKTELIPEQSIENTQVFNVKDEWAEEVSCFSDELGEYLYKFPFRRKPQREKMFDK